MHQHTSTVAFWRPTNKNCHSPPPHPPPFSVCPSNRKSSPTPSPKPLHLLSSPLLHECWGVGGGHPRAGHPVRGLLRVPGLSAGAYWGEIHINTCLLCLPPLDTARLPAWHRQHCMGLLSRPRERMGFQCECGAWVRTSCQSSCCTDGPEKTMQSLKRHTSKSCWCL